MYSILTNTINIILSTRGRTQWNSPVSISLIVVIEIRFVKIVQISEIIESVEIVVVEIFVLAILRTIVVVFVVAEIVVCVWESAQLISPS